MLYTGFGKEQFTLLAKKIVSNIDILIAGKYIEEKRDIFLTEVPASKNGFQPLNKG